MPELLAPLLSSQLAMLQHRPMLTAAEAAAFLPAANHVVAPPAPPLILVKQGVSRCEECNIVFNKVENYEVHKKHYCSARPRSAESGSPEEGGKAASTPSPTPSQTAPAPPGKILKQYICAHCGIKFSSITNLKVHQTHYCVKREINQQLTNNNEPPPERKKCSKCKVSLAFCINYQLNLYQIMRHYNILRNRPIDFVWRKLNELNFSI
jgi:zinc finger protein ZFPM1